MNTSSAMPIIIAGASGRMGQCLAAQTSEKTAVKLVGLVEAADHKALGTKNHGVAITDDLSALLAEAAPHCGLIDFTRAGSVAERAQLAAHHKAAAYVVGTTSLTDDDKNQLERAAEKIPVIASENMSLGIALMAFFVRRAAEMLAPEQWDIEIREIHHRDKIDAPSGTAFLLGRAAALGRGEKLDDLAAHHAPSPDRPRQTGQIGFAASRGGHLAGAHDVMFAADHEVLTLSHQAMSREIFAEGALRACLWGREQKAGLYTINDVLGIK